MTKKEKKHGRHRQTKADHRDPGDQAAGSTQGAAGGTPQGACLISQSIWASGTPQAPPWFRHAFGSVPEPEPTPELDTVQDDMPILAHRWAHLDFSSKPRFKSLNAISGTFGRHATAKCRDKWNLNLITGDPKSVPDHSAPDVGCTCGFYAVPPDVLPDWAQPDAVELQVQLSGRVIEHERGYRAQHQTVLSAVAPGCVCGKPAVRAWVAGGWVVAWDCGSHDVTGGQTAIALTLEDLSSALGVPFKAAT